MPRDKKPLKLRPVDGEPIPQPVRLTNRETPAHTHKTTPVRLKAPHALPADSHRLEPPSKEERERRTHEPGIEAIIEGPDQNIKPLEHDWGTDSSRRNPIPWGWFALIGLLITGAVVWSLNHVRKAEVQTVQIQAATESTLLAAKQDDQEATETIDRINATIQDFFSATTVDTLAPLIRQPERVIPLMRKYYAVKPVFSGHLKAVQLFLPLSINNCANFWMITATLDTGTTQHIIVEELDNKEIRIDWETLVCYQPIPWDEFAIQRPADTSLDFRVTVKRDNFYSHEFANSQHWACYLLETPNSPEALFGYAPAGSPLANAIDRQIDANDKHQATLILRLSIPERLQSRRGVIIEKILSYQWLYFTPPAEDS